MYDCFSIQYDIRTIDVLFFFNDTATTEIYTLSLHDALPIFGARVLDAVVSHVPVLRSRQCRLVPAQPRGDRPQQRRPRSEEHTSELQSRQYIVCRLLLEKKNQTITIL